MMENCIVNRSELIDKLKQAKFRVRILGSVAFDIPYELFREDWLNRINNGTLSVEIICESEPDLEYYSLLSTNRKITQQDRSYDIGHFFRLKNEPAIKLRDYLLSHNCKHLEPKGENPLRSENGMPEFEMLEGRKVIKFNPNEDQFFSLRTCYNRIFVPIINIDEDYYYSLSLTKFCTLDLFEKITENSIWFDHFKKYIHAYLDSDIGARKFSTEITSKDNRTEVIYMYNDKRQCMGQLPRNSFLEIPKAKNVIWGLIFSRDGRILIHKRGKNAKDNKNMWDKSIGGHVDIEKDTVDSVKAASREMLEELYKLEAEDQGLHSNINIAEINPDKPLHLGEWKEQLRQTLPFKEIRNKRSEMYYFRMNYNFSKRVVDSPRILPDLSESPVKCFVDVYAFIMNEDFDDKKLENSNYKLFELHELYDCYLGEEIEYYNNVEKSLVREKFIATPDLKKIITSELWIELTAFSEYLKEGLK